MVTTPPQLKFPRKKTNSFHPLKHHPLKTDPQKERVRPSNHPICVSLSGNPFVELTGVTFIRIYHAKSMFFQSIERRIRSKDEIFRSSWDVDSSQTCLMLQLPSRELTYPTWGKGKSSSKVPFWSEPHAIFLGYRPKQRVNKSLFEAWGVPFLLHAICFAGLGSETKMLRLLRPHFSVTNTNK